MKQKRISLVIPAYKQEKTIEKDVEQIEAALKNLQREYTYEIIVVVDGFLDGTYKNAKRIKSSKVSVVGYEHNQGKGAAVRFGMSRAKGDIIGFIDAGMDINPKGISMLLEHFYWYDADVVVGSKLHPVSKVNYPRSRKILSMGYRFLTRVMFGFKVKDTQVGLKLFKREVVKKVLSKLLVKKYAFDIEFLAVAYRKGFTRIYEAPVEIIFNNASNISSRNFWRVVGRMIWDTVAVFYRLKILHYYD